MAAQVVGSREELRDRHYISAMVCTVSPLVLEGPATDVAMIWAENHVPVHITGMAQMGLTGPATIAGDLVLNHAETLGLACAIQAHEPGAPLLYGSVLSSMDPMSGAIDFGTPETIRLALGSAEMAKYMKWPGSCGGIGPGAIVPGVQATIENALMTMSAAMVGSEVMNGIGLLDNSTVLAYEQLLMDNEMIGHTLGICKEIEFTPESLAVDLIKKVGINRTYLTERHTIKHTRNFHRPMLWKREGFDAWEKGGRKDTLALAREKADWILREHKPEPLSSAVSEKLGEIVGSIGK
jgi:trimethylamine--corrinoid protein Co-methyltransferase